MLLDHILHRLGFIRPHPTLIPIDEELLGLLQHIAAKNGLTVPETAHQLLSFAVGEHFMADENLSNWYALTGREKEAAAFTCLGYTNQEIAEKMVISPNTVKSHLRNVLTKFDVNSKAELQVLLATWNFEAWDKPDMDAASHNSRYMGASPHGATP